MIRPWEAHLAAAELERPGWFDRSSRHRVQYGDHVRSIVSRPAGAAVGGRAGGGRPVLPRRRPDPGARGRAGPWARRAGPRRARRAARARLRPARQPGRRSRHVARQGDVALLGRPRGCRGPRGPCARRRAGGHLRAHDRPRSPVVRARDHPQPDYGRVGAARRGLAARVAPERARRGRDRAAVHRRSRRRHPAGAAGPSCPASRPAATPAPRRLAPAASWPIVPGRGSRAPGSPSYGR